MFVIPFVICTVITNNTYTDQTKDTEEPNATNVSIFGEPCMNDLNPLIKNFLLITIKINVRNICVKPKPI